MSPALRSSRVDVAPGLRQTGLVQRARGRRRGVNALLVGQLALSVVLLVSALEVAATLRAALSVDLGFSTRGVYQVSVDWRAIPDAAARADADVIASTLHATPGIQTASISYPAAYGRPTASTSAFVDRRGPARGAPGTVEYQTVGPEFFQTLGMAIVNGRPFVPSDREGAEPVVILNERAARELFPGGHPVGQRFGLFGPQHRVTVIGIAHDMRLHSPMAPAPAVAYVPLAQNGVAVPPGSLMIEVHAAASAVAASDISRVIAGVDPRLKVEVQPLAALVAQSLAAERLSAWATAAFGALGVILAMMGVYGLHAYVVSRRTTELGIRLALGAPRGRVLWGIWKDGMRPVAIGSALGLWLAVLAAAVLRHSVAGLSAADAEAALIAAVTLASIAGAACYIPARAAARLDPARALRAD